MLSRGSGKLVFLVKKTTHVLAKGGGNFELVSYKYERVVFVFLVTKNNACICQRGWPVLVVMVQMRLYCSQGGAISFAR